MRFLILVAAVILPPAAFADDTLRVATYNVSLYGDHAGQIAERLSDGFDDQAERIARVVQTVRPDVLLINELDHDDQNASVTGLQKILADGDRGIDYPHRFAPPSNTGVPSGLDLDRDGRTDGPADAWGYGKFPGQYALAILSRYPIDKASIRTFAKFRWADLPGVTPPDDDSGVPYYDDAVWQTLKLSSKNHVDVPIVVGDRRLHVLASHPTPPVFDGPEDRNGLRNRDEIVFWRHYIDNHDAIRDDSGATGGLPAGESFVIAGDLNSDPDRGDSIRSGIAGLIAHHRVGEFVPLHDNADDIRQRNTTAQFGRGRVRVDYVLPSSDLTVTGGGVHWPADGSAAEDVEASDHRLVWIDVALPIGAAASDVDRTVR